MTSTHVPPGSRDSVGPAERGHGGEFAGARPALGEEQVAGPAAAHQGPALEIDDVGVFLGDRLVAQLAVLALGWSGLLEEPLETLRKGLLGLAGGTDEATEAPRPARVLARGHSAPPAPGFRPISTFTRERP